MVFQSKLKRVFFFGELPARTIHGASISNLINVEILKKKFILDCIEEYSDLKYHKSFSLSKFNFFLKSLLKSWKLFPKFKYDFFYGVIYLSSTGILKNLLLITVFKFFNPSSKVVLHFHRSDHNIFLKKWHCKILYFFLDFFVSKYIVLSKIQHKEIASISKNNVYLLYNSIQESQLFFSTKVLKKTNKINVVFCSNFLKEKGFFDLIKVFCLLEERFPNLFVLNCYGEFSDFMDKFDLNTLEHSNIFINKAVFGIDKNNVLNSADLIVLPSYNEGLPLVLLEALFLNIPIIISNVGYISEALGDDYPFYCIPGDIDSIFNSFVKFKDYFFSDLYLDLRSHYFKFSLQEHEKNLLKVFL